MHRVTMKRWQSWQQTADISPSPRRIAPRRAVAFCAHTSGRGSDSVAHAASGTTSLASSPRARTLFSIGCTHSRSPPPARLCRCASSSSSSYARAEKAGAPATERRRRSLCRRTASVLRADITVSHGEQPALPSACRRWCLARARARAAAAAAAAGAHGKAVLRGAQQQKATQ